MQTILTEVFKLEKSPGIDPFSVYRRSVLQYGNEHAFLAESISGPLEDCRNSLVAIGHLATISINQDAISVNANDVISKNLIKTIESSLEAEIQFSASGEAKIKSKKQIWDVLRALTASSYRSDLASNGFHAGFVARIDYDAAAFIEDFSWRMPRKSSPLIRLDLFQHTAVFQEDCIFLYVNRASGFGDPVVADLKALFTPAEQPLKILPKNVDVNFSSTKEEYLLACHKALEHIHAGDIYQVQLGHSIDIRNEMPPSAFYALLREQNPSPYMFLHQAPDMDLVGASPENYVRVEGRRLSMRPIAGTLGKSEDLDAQKLYAELTSSQKENAEHIMLVDLCRNDVGRLCEPGTLTVSSLMKMEEFPSLYHLISTVEGNLQPEVDPVDVLMATFPAGTMVGAPKIRAMEIIEDLENSPRGQYAGAIGFIGFDGSMNMALCIRMACHKDGNYQIRASAGIVYDSNPEREWQETLTKMRLLYRTLTNKEIIS
ncbi:anthranilate synthase component I family protein [Comamonas testosteroni]|uniref:anthranilate synthase component I family protein n=1 Tax=Comamonas testosteroni TaxID=285 RepID=UPI0015F7FBBA|nr:anthranilate synthase component I family protein [Comamonas testosteroni]